MQMNMRTKQGVLLVPLIFFSIFFFIHSPTYAFTTRTGNDVTIPKTETINDTLFVSGQHIRVDGNVNGDIICAGQSIEITSTVEGDILCAGQDISITGVVNGNVRSAGQQINMSGQVARNVTIFGQNVTSSANIGGEMFATAQSLGVSGTVGKNLQANAENVKIDGQIGKNVSLTVNKLILGNNAKINGQLSYTSGQTASIPSGVVAGKVTRNYPPQQATQNREESLSWQIFKAIISIVTHIIVTLVIVAVWPLAMIRISNTMMAHAGKAIGIGALILFITPIILVAVVLTIIGIPIAILLGIAYALAIFLSRIFVAITVGREITGNYWKTKKDSLIWASIIGVIVTWIIYYIPIIGGIATFVAILWGLGGVYFLLRPATNVEKINKK